MTTARRTLVGRLLPPVVMAVAILTMSTSLGSAAATGGFVDPFLEKLGFSPEVAEAIHRAGRTVGHVVAYALFAVLALRATRGEGPVTGRAALLAWTLAVALATVDETLQSLAGSRTAKATDVAIDAAGAALGLSLAAWRARRRAAAATAP